MYKRLLAIAIYLFFSMLFTMIKRTAVSFSMGGMLILVLYVSGNISERMSYAWYNLIPTKSFELQKYIFKSNIVDEIEYFNNNLRDVDNRFGLWIVIAYDLILLICFFLTGMDHFKREDY